MHRRPPPAKTGMVQIKVTSLRRVWSPKPFPVTKHYEDATFLFARGYKFKPRVWSRRPHRRGGVCPVTRFWDILNLARKLYSRNIKLRQSSPWHLARDCFLALSQKMPQCYGYNETNDNPSAFQRVSSPGPWGRHGRLASLCPEGRWLFYLVPGNSRREQGGGKNTRGHRDGYLLRPGTGWDYLCRKFLGGSPGFLARPHGRKTAGQCPRRRRRQRQGEARARTQAQEREKSGQRIMDPGREKLCPDPLAGRGQPALSDHGDGLKRAGNRPGSGQISRFV